MYTNDENLKMITEQLDSHKKIDIEQLKRVCHLPACKEGMEFLVSLSETYNELLDEEKGFQDKINIHKKDILDLKQDILWSISKYSESILVAGEMLLKFEMLIVNKIFNFAIIIPFHTIKCMIKVLKSGYYEDPATKQKKLELTKDQQEQANADWEDLKNRLSWQRKDENTLHNLKNGRLEVAHPPLPDNLDQVLEDNLVKEAFGKDFHNLKRFYCMYKRMMIDP
jgi:hypothetical protein